MARRIGKEYSTLTEKPLDWLHIELPDANDLYNWNATIQGPSETPYAKGWWTIRLQLPPDYPFKPPTVCSFLFYFSKQSKQKTIKTKKQSKQKTFKTTNIQNIKQSKQHKKQSTKRKEITTEREREFKFISFLNCCPFCSSFFDLSFLSFHFCTFIYLFTF